MTAPVTTSARETQRLALIARLRGTLHVVSLWELGCYAHPDLQEWIREPQVRVEAEIREAIRKLEAAR